MVEQRVGGQETNNGAAGGEALGTSMARDVRLGEDRELIEEGEVTGKIISNEGSVKRGMPRLDGVGVFEIFENLISLQNSPCQEI